MIRRATTVAGLPAVTAAATPAGSEHDWPAEALALTAPQAATVAPLIRHESEYKGATDVKYRLSPDGEAALAAGNAAEVIARRLPD